jgi:two-component system, NarL family, sensor histidine kinase UhpB
MKQIFFPGLSIRQRLPFLICSLLLTVILLFGIISYLGVRKAALNVGQNRLQTLSKQLSEILSTSSQNLCKTTYTQANRPSVKTYLATGGKDSISEVTNLFKDILNDSTNARVELLNAEKKVLLNFGKAPTPLSSSVNELNSTYAADLDSVRVGNFYAVANQLYYPVLTSIKEGNTIKGYLVSWRKLHMKSRAVDQLSQLMGADVKFYLGNSNGSLWTDMIAPVPPPTGLKANQKQVFHFARYGKDVFACVTPITRTTWLLSVELSRDNILQTANDYIHWLLIAVGILLIVAIFFSWLMGRNLTRPLSSLTAATSQIAAGNYSTQVPVNRRDEIGKLARAFNAMAVQLKNSQRKLQEKADSYKLLFEKNPMPMWIMSTTTFHILDVNEAAVQHYGYQKEEFLKLNAINLRPEEDISKFLQTVPKQLKGRKKHGIWRHKKKDGTVIMVDMVTDDTIYKNQSATLTVAEDVTERLKAEAELVRSRVMQQELITETTILAQEKEREEIGKELHDNINQILASTKLYLEMARSGNKARHWDAIEKSYDNIKLVMGEIRHLSKQLVRPAFDTSLKESLQDLTTELHAITPININFDATGFDESQLDENIKVMIYRIVQEQMNNILKHAAASEVWLTIKTNSTSVQFSIEDNGIGFDMTKKSKGIGLRNIDNRVQFYKGNLHIQTSPGHGCMIAIEVPLKRPIVLYS